MQIVRTVGFTIKSRIIRKKASHGSGDTETTFAPQHESLIHATKGKVKLSKRLPDVLEGFHLLDTDHPTPKPIDLMEKLIEVTTYENDVVVDCFMGCGSTGVAAVGSRRKFWGCEIDKGYWEEALNNIYKIAEEIVG